jgi:SAM-dependent methyltransferase
VRYSVELGVALPEEGWVPSPSFVLRRAAILECVDGWEPGEILEVGCGAGAILYELAVRGFSGVGVEASARARELAGRVVEQTPIGVTAELPDEPEQYDYLLSFEVLEHIEDDIGALRSWARRVKPGGRCLLSVPAGQKRWNLTDVLAGHFRRYDKEDFVELIEGAGLRLTRLQTCGWPATWFIERLRLIFRTVQVRLHRIEPNKIGLGDPVRTSESGVDRELETSLFPLYGSFIGRNCLQLAARVQRPFMGRDWGISFLAEAEKR